MASPTSVLKREQKEAFAGEFSRRIRKLRRHKFGTKRGSKSAAAASIGVTPADWRGYENGVIPGADKIKSMVAVFKCDPYWLLGLAAKDEQGLTNAQKQFVDSLSELQQSLHAFDEMFTNCLLTLQTALAQPSMMQEHCFKLYSVAQKVGQLRKEVIEQGNSDQIPISEEDNF